MTLHLSIPPPMVWHPIYSQVPLPPSHPFPMAKFDRLHALLLRDGVIDAGQIQQPQRASRAVLARAHCPDYLARFASGELTKKEIRRQGFPWSRELVVRSETAVAGTCLTLQLALEHGLACHLAGGTHHAHRDFASGYCLLNDLAVAASLALHTGRARRILILDCDVHQGDGTARIFADEPRVFTLSVHAGTNFPARKAVSDLDVVLPRGTNGDAYMRALQRELPRVIEKFQPDCLIYDAGADVHRDDRLGHFELTDADMLARDRYAIETGLNAGLPVACVIGGGYDRDIEALVYRHSQLHRAAMAIWREQDSTAPAGLSRRSPSDHG